MNDTSNIPSHSEQPESLSRRNLFVATVMAGIFLVPERIQNIFEKPQENYKTIELSKSHTSHKLLDGEFQKLFHSLYIDESPRNWSNMAA